MAAGPVLDAAGAVWVANEWIAEWCTFERYLQAPLGQCGGIRSALANGSTRISKVARPWLRLRQQR